MKSLPYLSRSGFSNITSRKLVAKLLVCVCLCTAAFAMLGLGVRQDGGFIAHEWGTFTSVQGGDGILLDWRPLETTRLPKFVYDWTKPGLNRRAAGALGTAKGWMAALQRMETPVVYFYADKEQTIDLSVRFPKGFITEWYPQAREIGPSTLAPHPAFVALDNAVRKSGLPSGFSFVSTFGNSGIKDSLIRWNNVQILPADQNRNVGGLLPRDASGSHYFAARETDAAFVRADSLIRTNTVVEQEKFLFYRGVGSFATPLHVTMNANNEVILTNTGKESLAHLFLLTVQNRHGKFIYLEQLPPGEQRTIQIDSANPPLPPDRLAPEISNAMTLSLLKEGLYRREAVAMVDTWKDSWFEEDGTRILYLLPRAWTDRTLPMTVNPQPRELIRVMVGRAEIITPATQQELASQMALQQAGNAQAKERVQARLKQFGRFAGPAQRLATDYLGREQKKAVAEQARK